MSNSSTSINGSTTIEAESLSFAYGNPYVLALDEITFNVGEGKFVAIMGPNGSGKTTLIKLFLGLLEPTSGNLTVHGMKPWIETELVQRKIGYVPQREHVNTRLPISVRDVIQQGTDIRLRGKIPPSEIKHNIDKSIELAGLTDLSSRPFNALSGGEQQRALIARALAVNPKILVLDEPFSAVDVSNQQLISAILKRLVVENLVTIFAAVHNINVLVHDLDSVMLLNHRLIAFDKPEKVLTQETLREAYGIDIPILVCDEGYHHPIMEDTHGRDG